MSILNLFTPKAYAQLGPIRIHNFGIADPQVLMRNIIRGLLITIGAVGLIAIIIGGYQYITAGGNAEQAAKGKNTVLGALIGIALAFAAYAIIRFIVGGMV